MFDHVFFPPKYKKSCSGYHCSAMKNERQNERNIRTMDFFGLYQYIQTQCCFKTSNLIHSSKCNSDTYCIICYSVHAHSNIKCVLSLHESVSVLNQRVYTNIQTREIDFQYMY